MKLLFLLLTMTSAWSMTDAQLTSAMRAELAPALGSMKQAKLIFHWADASDIQLPGQFNAVTAANAPHFRNYVQTQGRKIFNRRSLGDTDAAGPGLYFATDPNVSREYGGQKRFGLIVGLLRPGLKLAIDMVMVSFGASVKAELLKRNCGVPTYQNLLFTSDPYCTKVKQLLVGSDISFADAQFYPFTNQLDAMPGCRRVRIVDDLKKGKIHSSVVGDYDAFVAYSPAAFTEILGFTHKTMNGGSALGKKVLSYLKYLDSTGEYYELISEEQRNSATITAMSKAEAEAFSRQYLMGCRP